MSTNPTAITDFTIGTDIHADPDYVLKEEAITTSAITSDEFILGQTSGGVEIKVTTNAAMTLPEDEVLTFEFQTAAATGGTFATYQTLTMTGGTGDTDFAEDAELFRYIVDRELADEIYSKVVLTPDSTSLASSVNAYLVIVP